MKLLDTSAEAFEQAANRAENLLWDNGYPGRFLTIGRLPAAKGVSIETVDMFMGYSLGGRSPQSKDRNARQEDNAVRLIAPDKTVEEMAQQSDAALVYYHAMDGADGVFVVSNGAQTRPVLAAIREGATLEEAVNNAPTEPGKVNGKDAMIDLSSFEPDEPIFTPRITGVIDLREDAPTPFGLAVVRKNLETGNAIRTFWTADLADVQPGQGWAIQTYGINDPADRVTPVPHFEGAPYAFEPYDRLSETAASIEEAIGEATFAAAVVRRISVETGQFSGNSIINTRG